MKMNVEVLADLIIHSFLKGVEHKEDGSDIGDVLDEYYLFRPVDSGRGDDKDGDWNYTLDDQT